jgi:hypothetical protein
VHGEPLGAGTVIPRRPKRVRAHEHALVGPPEGDFVPADRDEDEGRKGCTRQDGVPHAQPAGDLSAVAVMAIEQLDHTDDVLQLADVRALDRIDEPRAVVGQERVRRALEKLVLDPLD